MRLYCPHLPGSPDSKGPDPGRPALGGPVDRGSTGQSPESGTDQASPAPEIVEIRAEEFRYAKNVLRAKPGDEVSLFDGKGRLAKGVIAAVRRDRLVVRIGEISDSVKESALSILLLPAILKGQKMDFAIQKAVELGVARIKPLITGRTQVSETRKIDRWRKISIEAARQCGRSLAPPVDEPVAFRGYFEGLQPPSGKGGGGIIFWEGGGTGLRALSERLRGADRIAVAVGPEGGFSAEEAGLAGEAGFHIATLGPRILRAETAAVLAVGLVQFLFGDIG